MAKKVIRPLRSEAEYNAALTEIERYFENEPKRGTPQADHFDLLALIIEDYERRHWPIESPDPVTAIRFRMETGGYSQADLGRLLGSRQRASEILARKRPLTLQMTWKLHSEWGIPAEALLRPQTPMRPRNARSSVIQDYEYDRSSQKLEITFVSGKTYVYDKVPPGIYEDFVSASSRGKFFNKHIRDYYSYTDITKMVG